MSEPLSEPTNIAEKFLHHMTEINKTVLNISDESNYCYYLPISIGKVGCVAMLDSGNLWRNVINTTLLHELGLTIQDLREIPGTPTIATAKKGASLRVLGELAKPLYLKLGDMQTKFKTRPVVLEGLAMKFNMCGPFLKLNSIDQLHSEDSIRVQGKKIKLEKKGAPREESGEVSNVYIQDDITIAPMTVQHVEAKALGRGGREGLVRGDEAFMEKTNLSPWTGTMVKSSENGYMKVGVINTLEEPVTIKAGTRYGKFLPNPPKWREQVQTVGSPPEVDRKEEAASAKTEEQKKLFLTKTFRLTESPYLQKKIDLERALAILLHHWEVFSFDGSFGKTNLIKHSIRTDQNQQPINQRYRPLNPSLEPDLQRQIEKWLEHDVIETSSSPWNFGLVAAPKKNGKIRWCVDYRALNQVSEKDSHPIGHIEDNLARLARSTIFSGIDGSGAFHVIELEEKDRPKTSFATPWGSYQFTRMPFGLSGGPSTYARLVQMVLRGIPYNIALPYLDDTVVHSRTLEEHFQALHRVLEAHSRAGLKLQPDKCQLFQDKIEYLGHVVTGKGIGPMPSYVDVVTKWPTPTNRTQVRAFLGKLGYYRRFIPNYSAKTRLLTDKLLQDGTTDKEEFEPSAAFTKTFKELRDCLTKAPILAYPQFDSPEMFILDTDWSQENNAIGAVLSQNQGGEERVIAYGAKKLSKAQSSYSSTKGEMAAVIIFMRQWRYYLQHRRFLLRVDNQSLKWMQTMEAPQGMIQRWHETLANFDFQVQHRPGTQHGNADGLSRAAHAATDGEATDISMGERMGALMASLEEDPEWTDEFIRAQQILDDDIAPILRCLEKKAKPSIPEVTAASRVGKIYWGYFDNLYIKNGILRYRQETTTPEGKSLIRHLLIVPKDLWGVALKKAHLASAHMGPRATVERAQRHVYFPGMLREAEEGLRGCSECQTKTGKITPQRHTLMSHQEGYPFQKLSIDFVGPLPSSRRGNNYLLTVRDTFTRWLEAFPVRAATAAAVIRKLEVEIFPRYGLCDQIHSDRGTQFMSDLVRAVASELGIRTTATPSYNPKSNPVERAHRDLETAITALVGNDQRGWEEVLPQVLFAMRTARCRSTGVAPYQMLFGRDASTSLHLIFGGPEPSKEEFQNGNEYAIALRHRVEAAHAWARRNMGAAIDRQRRAYHKDKKSFQQGDLVWLFTPKLRPGQSKKFATYWTGPWMVDRRVNDLLYEIRPDPSWQRKHNEVVSIDRLKTYYPNETDGGRLMQPPPADADLRLQGDEHAEHLPDDDDDDDDEGQNPRPVEVQQDPDPAAGGLPFMPLPPPLFDDEGQEEVEGPELQPQQPARPVPVIPARLPGAEPMRLRPDRPDRRVSQYPYAPRKGKPGPRPGLQPPVYDPPENQKATRNELERCRLQRVRFEEAQRANNQRAERAARQLQRQSRAQEQAQEHERGSSDEEVTAEEAEELE